jgi:hypothetical protein
MGVSLKVWVHAMETPHDRLFGFKTDELKSLNLVTAAAVAPVNSSPVIPANAGIHNHRYLLHGRTDSSPSAAIGSLSALPASGLFGRSTESLCLFALLRPAQLDGAAAFNRHRIPGGINVR